MFIFIRVLLVLLGEYLKSLKGLIIFQEYYLLYEVLLFFISIFLFL